MICQICAFSALGQFLTVPSQKVVCEVRWFKMAKYTIYVNSLTDSIVQKPKICKTMVQNGKICEFDQPIFQSKNILPDMRFFSTGSIANGSFAKSV